MSNTAYQVSQAGVAAGGTIATALLPAAAVPIVGAAVVAAGLALTLFFSRKGPGQKIATTQIVNDLEPILAQNRDAYLAGPRTTESQTAALMNFDQAWAWLQSAEACGAADMGEPGRRCISERSRGGRWDWFALYRDPIAADTPTDPAGALVASFGTPELLLPLAAIAVALVVL